MMKFAEAMLAGQVIEQPTLDPLAHKEKDLKYDTSLADTQPIIIAKKDEKQIQFEDRLQSELEKAPPGRINEVLNTLTERIDKSALFATHGKLAADVSLSLMQKAVIISLGYEIFGKALPVLYPVVKPDPVNALPVSSFINELRSTAFDVNFSNDGFQNMITTVSKLAEIAKNNHVLAVLISELMIDIDPKSLTGLSAKEREEVFRKNVAQKHARALEFCGGVTLSGQSYKVPKEEVETVIELFKLSSK